MAASGFTPIQLYHSTTAAAAPTAGNLNSGELAININDGKLFYKDSGGTVQTIATKDAAAGNFTTVDTTNLEVTNIKAKDGTAAASIADSTGVITVTAAPVMSALTASQAVFTTAGKALTSNAITGTGNVVMSASPTLTGTIAGASLQLSSLTSGRVTYAGASGLLTDSANLLYSGTDLTVYGVTVGRGAGAVSTNTAVGASALAANATGSGMTAVGSGAFASNTTGAVGAAFGINAGTANTTGNYNVVFGPYALDATTTGSSNTAVGAEALGANTTASNNTAVGYQAAYSNTTGSVTAVGKAALKANTTGAENTTVGSDSLQANTTGNANSALGLFALFANTTGSYNTAIGRSALEANTTASNNTAVGYQAVYTNATGTRITAVGYFAAKGGAGSAPSYSVAIGSYALTSVTSGDSNSAVGDNALALNTTGSANSAVGQSALYNNTTGINNTALGVSALTSNTTSSNNTAVGYQAGYSNTTGAANCFYGYLAGYSSTGSGNTFVGGGSSGGANPAGYLSTGSDNNFLGSRAGGIMTTGSKNTILGNFNGNQGSLDIRTSSNYIVLSDGDGNPLLYHTGAVWQFNQVSTNDVIRLAMGASSAGISISSSASSMTPLYFSTTSGQAGQITCSGATTSYSSGSDYRLKDNIRPIQNGLALTMQMKPSEWEWKDSGKFGSGFIAHELEEICPQAVHGQKDAVNSDGSIRPQGVDTSFLVGILTAAIQELKSELDSVKAELATLKGN